MSALETAKEVVQNHNVIRIATIDANGAPCVRSVDYATGDYENILYAITRKDSRKAAQIKNNGNVAFTIDRDSPSWDALQKLKYIKGTGKASVIENPEEIQKAFGLLIKKFPFLANLPGEPSDFVALKIELKEVLVSDNTISFGHTESVTCDESCCKS